MHLYRLSLYDKFNNNSLFFEDKLNNRKSILVTGAHHSREPASYTFNLYLISLIITEYLNNNFYIVELLSQIDIYFVPVVNIDGLEEISKQYTLTNQLSYIRKNRNFNKDNNLCLFHNSGVDINRNYDIYYEHSKNSFYKNTCNEEYNGDYPFSEAESLSIKRMVEDIQRYSNNGLTIAFNYHAYGNMAIIPPNFIEEDPLPYLKDNYYYNYLIYLDILKNGEFPKDFIYGNGFHTVE